MEEVEVKASMDVGKVEPVEISMEPGEVGAVLELIVTDKDGNVTEYRKLKSKSFVRQFLELWYTLGYGPDSITYRTANYLVKDYGGTDRLVDADDDIFNSTGSADYQGIVVGTDNTAPTINDYSLAARITHGTGAGQLQYGAMTFGAPSAGVSISQIRLTRPFANASGGNVTVAEIGLYVYDGSYRYMTIRDVLGTPIVVPDGQTLTVNYQIQASI